MSDSSNFYRNLPQFADFREVADPLKFYPAPVDWWIIITDIKKSTQHIQEGRYKTVNLLGAACITAVINACKGENIPFVFGGDGATVLIPPHLKPTCEAALRATQIMAQKKFNMGLRVGFVSIKDLVDRGYTLQVAKLEIAKGNYLAMMRGSALQEAERLVKSRDDLKPSAKGNEKVDLEGLSCRWAPIDNQNGVILTLIVMAKDVANMNDIYRQILADIEKVVGGSERARPVSFNGLRPGKVFSSALNEMKLQPNLSLFKNLLSFGKRLGVIWLVVILYKTGWKLKNVDINAYMNEVPDNSDYRKFDGLLRMILDCSAADAKKIEDVLAAWHKNGKVYYGVHRSATALMTCFVKEIKANNHLHFIDGADGGYTMAAKKMKEQIKVDENPGLKKTV